MTPDFAEGLKMSPQQATFEALLGALAWRIVRREKDRVIIERVNTGEQAEVKAKENKG